MKRREQSTGRPSEDPGRGPGPGPGLGKIARRRTLQLAPAALAARAWWPAAARAQPRPPGSVLANGSPFAGEQAALPRQVLLIQFAGGPALIPADRQGLTEILGKVLEQGSTSLREDAYRRRLFLLNADVSFASEERALAVRIAAPLDRLEETLAVVRGVLEAPALEPQLFRHARDKVLAETAVRDDNMSEVVFYLGLRDAFGYHPDFLDGAGSRRSVGAVTLEEVKAALPRLLDYRSASFSTAGPAPAEQVKSQLDRAFFPREPSRFRYTGRGFQSVDPGRFQRPTRSVTVIDRPGATDNQLLFVFPQALRNDGPERAVAEVTHHILGGGITGRLGETLRSKRGLTYHAGTMLLRRLPAWMVWTFGGNQQVPGLLAGVPEVIERFRKEKLTAAEVREASNVRIASFREARELPMDRLLDRARFRLFGLDDGYLDRHEEALAAVTTPAVQAFARQLDAAGGYLYLMGDQKVLRPILAKAGVPGDHLRVLQLDQMA